MTVLLYGVINISLLVLFAYLFKKKDLLGFFEGGRWWLTWLAIGIITLMDELTSIYYAPFEAYRFIGFKAIIYIALTSLLIRFLSTRMVEIGEILEVNNIKGGGVYSFSYLVLGPNISFIAIASILVVYILTAAISTVSAVQNGTAFMAINPGFKFVLSFAVVWAITGLNILGIKENARFTFYIFIFAAFVLVNLITGGFLNFNSATIERLSISASQFAGDFNTGSLWDSYYNIIVGIGSCILAYSGIESVLQTASLTKSWHQTRKAYVFLAVTVGIVTPLIALFALSGNFDINNHETDLIPYFAESILGSFFGVLVSILASVTLIMAVNTAMLASSELIEKVVEKYGYHWLTRSNKNQSFYRIHILNGICYTVVLFVTSGSQAMLAEMYAVGLIASFCINIISILKYRYSKGTKEITYHTSRLGTLLLLLILLSTFIYIVSHRPYGTLLWLGLTVIFVIVGIRISKKRSPEIPVKLLSDNPMNIIFTLVEMNKSEVHILFKRVRESYNFEENDDRIFISFFRPRVETPEKLNANHFWLPTQNRTDTITMIEALLELLEYEIPPEITVNIHFGWPLSSWYDRLSTGILVYRMIQLPKKYTRFNFIMESEQKKQ